MRFTGGCGGVSKLAVTDMVAPGPHTPHRAGLLDTSLMFWKKGFRAANKLPSKRAKSDCKSVTIVYSVYIVYIPR